MEGAILDFLTAQCFPQDHKIVLPIRLSLSGSQHIPALQAATEGLATSFCPWKRDPGHLPELQQTDSMTRKTVMASFMVASRGSDGFWMWRGIVGCVSVGASGGFLYVPGSTQVVGAGIGYHLGYFIIYLVIFSVE